MRQQLQDMERKIEKQSIRAMISKLQAVIIDNSLDMRKGGSHYCSLITAHIVAFQRYDLTDNGHCDVILSTLS
jgi:hypothetical protein